MWPEPGEALNRDIAYEAAVEDLYAEALRRWHPTLKASVLPALTAATLPPNPEAAQEQAGDEWVAIAAGVVVGGAALLWAASVVEAMLGLGIPLPPLPTMRGDRQDVAALREVAMEDATVVRTVLKSIDMTRDELEDAVDRVESSPALAAARDEFVEHQRERAAELPAVVTAKVELAVTQANEMANGANVPQAVRQTDVRDAAATAVDPAGSAMRDIARTAGYQAAAVQNHAIVTAAAVGETEDDPLDKVWIATMDGKTRPSHWAADGQRAPLAGTFTVGGEAMAFPADPAASARERKNCRCRVGVLGRDEQLPSDVDRHTERLNGRDAVQINRQGSQQDEIDRRNARGNTRARDTADGVGTVASGGWAAPSEQELEMPKASTATLAAEDDTEANTEMFRTFTDAVIALVGEPTSDGRMLAKDIDLSMRSFPHPLMWCKQSAGAHDDAYTIGVIESARTEGGKVFGSGYLLNTAEADEAANELAHKVTSPSVDLASSEWIMTDKDGNEVDYDDYIASIEAGDPIELYTTVVSAELIGTTLVATAAFGDTSLTLNAERETREVPLVASVVASFQPRVYPAAFFKEPETAVPVRSTITEDGRVFGYIAAWDEKHRSVGLGNITPPRTTTGYREFHTSPPVRLDDGTELAVGRLTVGIGHAATVGVSAAEAAAHYDNADACWALVRVGENHLGIWYSGVAAPWATAEQVEKGLAAPLSGDWRDYGMGLELVAALAVNTPGFNVRGATDASGRELAMVASLAPAPTAGTGVRNLSADDLADIVGRAVTTALAKREADTELAGLLAAANQITRPPTPAEEIAELLEGRA